MKKRSLVLFIFLLVFFSTVKANNASKEPEYAMWVHFTWVGTYIPIFFVFN